MNRTAARHAALLVVVAATTGASAQTPPSLWQQIPLLPDVAETAQCDAADEVATQIEQAAAASMASAQSAMTRLAPMAAMSDVQGAALEQILDYSLQECVTGAETAVRQLVDETLSDLAAAIDYLGDRRIAALDKCGSEQSPGYEACFSRTNIEYQALGRDEANRRLNELGVVYSQWRDTAKRCLDRREQASAAFEKAKMSGPFAAQGVSMRVMSWSLVHLHAETSKTLCEAVRDAAHALDVIP